jgi:hypothetical protein
MANERENPNYHVFLSLFFIAFNIRASFHEDIGGSTSIITEREVEEKRDAA